jgi:type III secretion system FlhB-like substrate exporter
MHEIHMNTTPLKVVALQYEEGEGVPRVIMKAIGTEAEAALRMNRAGGGVRVVRDKALADQLYRLPIDGEIGRELYGVVARLLVHIFAVEGRMMKEAE